MNAPIQIEELSLNVRKLGQHEAALQEVARIAQQEMARIAVEMSESERIILRKDEMLKALNRLQIKAQEKNKGLFEGLLTNLVQEVMVGKKDQVVLTSTLKNNRASLDFDILCDGNLENISEDKGGSIANIVAMGLRFIVLARHPNRRILLLDETDCHLKSEYIPAFAAVMRQLAVKMGIQVIYISHHNPANFVGYGRVLELYSEKGKTHSRISHEETDEDKQLETMSAFRYLRLRDYGPHENLLVELSPGLNIITGDNDLGKSKVIQAIVDLMANNGEERRIRHKRPFFEVEIGLEEGMTLSWKYQRKGSKRTQMTLKNSEGLEIETSDIGTGVPAWLDMYLSTPEVNGENIHFHSQKHPNYLLSSTDYTSIKRAELLPLGRESREVHRMIQLFNVRLSDARQNFTRLQRDMLQVKNTLAILAPILDDPMDMDQMEEGLTGIRSMLLQQERLQNAATRIANLQAIASDMSSMMASLSEHKSTALELKCSPTMGPSLINLEQLVERESILADMDKVKRTAEVPELHNLDAIRRIGVELGSLSKLSAMMAALQDLEPMPSVEIKASKPLMDAINAVADGQARYDSNAVQIKRCSEQKIGLAKNKAELFAKMGGVCPTCDNPLEGHSHD